MGEEDLVEEEGVINSHNRHFNDYTQKVGEHLRLDKCDACADLFDQDQNELGKFEGCTQPRQQTTA